MKGEYIPPQVNQEQEELFLTQLLLDKTEQILIKLDVNVSLNAGIRFFGTEISEWQL